MHFKINRLIPLKIQTNIILYTSIILTIVTYPSIERKNNYDNKNK